MTETVKRYDCSSGGAKFCQGCYTMEECEHGDYVGYEDYASLEREFLKQKERADAEQQSYDGLSRVLEAVKAQSYAAHYLLKALEMAEAKLCMAEHMLDLGEDDSPSFESVILTARAAIDAAMKS